VLPVDPIVRAKGAEIGVRTLALHRSTARDWLAARHRLELVFVGDAGTTEPSRPSRRLGFEWSNVYTLHRGSPWTPTSRIRRRASATRIRSAIGFPEQSRAYASAGVTADGPGPLSGSLRLRYFGPAR